MHKVKMGPFEARFEKEYRSRVEYILDPSNGLLSPSATAECTSTTTTVYEEQTVSPSMAADAWDSVSHSAIPCTFPESLVRLDASIQQKQDCIALMLQGLHAEVDREAQLLRGDELSFSDLDLSTIGEGSPLRSPSLS